MKKNVKRTLTLLLALVLCLGLLPTAALADEIHVSLGSPPPYTPPKSSVRGEAGPAIDGEVTVRRDEEKGGGSPSERVFITFESGPGWGEFSNGQSYVTIEAVLVPGSTAMWEVQFPAEDPVPLKEGYVFDGWYTWDASGNEIPVPKYVTAGNTVAAKWTPAESGGAPWWLNHPFKLDPNGGTVSPDTFMIDQDGKIVGKLPTPTRSGYTFQGWYIDGKLVDESKFVLGVTATAPFLPTAQWAKVRTSKTTPSVRAIPDKIEAGAKKVKLILQSNNGHVTMDWRPLERVVAPAKGSNLEAAVKNLLSGNFSDVGLKVTEIFYEDTMPPVNDDAYPYELYPEGVCPASGVTLTLEGEAKSGTLTITLAPENFLEYVPKGDNTVLDASSAQIFNAAQVKIPVGTPDGPFTVKFDLNYKNPPKAEIPKEQTINKGQTVDLPDGKKLTCPFTTHEFYAWCVKGADGKLYPWQASATVSSDMTLYAGWAKKGTAAPKPGEALPETPEKTPEPAAPKFKDVAPTSAFAEAIAWAVENGIANGKTADSFGPNDPCTRAHIVTFLWRAAGSPEPKTMEPEYADVTRTDAYYYKAVQWAAEMGMEESGTFAPNDPCTRGQAMYFIWKAKGSASAAGSAPAFKDLPKTSAYYDAVLWAVGQGVTTGKTADTFAPGDPCTRAHIVTFLYRAYAKK